MKNAKKLLHEEKLGFELPDNLIYRNFEKLYLPVRERRLKRWNDLLKVKVETYRTYCDSVQNLCLTKI